MRTCTNCSEAKPLTEFYPKGRKLDTRCKPCVRAKAASHRAANIERVRTYDRERSAQPHRVAARAAYAATPEGMRRHTAANQAWRARNRDRLAAHNAVNKALMRGKLARWPACAAPDCDGREVEAHHPDYSRPLDVVWLCSCCHKQAHALVRREPGETL